MKATITTHYKLLHNIFLRFLICKRPLWFEKTEGKTFDKNTIRLSGWRFLSKPEAWS